MFFTAYKSVSDHTVVAIKVLKPVRPQKYNRETKILLNLRGGPNIVQLLDIVQNPSTLQYSLIFEFLQEIDLDTLFNSITDYEARVYLYKLMLALRYSHSQGIMHRDVKPLNILFDRKTLQLRLIDWGLADFYHPGEKYNIHVASRHYKPPELLLDYQLYDYSVDIWSFGVTMAQIVFKKSPFFAGNDDLDMIVKITNVLGSKRLNKYTSKYSLPIPKSIERSVVNLNGKDWSHYVNSWNQELANPEALDLISKCVKFDHQERITADDALSHPYFDPVRNLPNN